MPTILTKDYPLKLTIGFLCALIIVAWTAGQKFEGLVRSQRDFNDTTARRLDAIDSRLTDVIASADLQMAIGALQSEVLRNTESIGVLTKSRWSYEMMARYLADLKEGVDFPLPDIASIRAQVDFEER